MGSKKEDHMPAVRISVVTLGFIALTLICLPMPRHAWLAARSAAAAEPRTTKPHDPFTPVDSSRKLAPADLDRLLDREDESERAEAAEEREEREEGSAGASRPRGTSNGRKSWDVRFHAPLTAAHRSATG